MNNTLNTALVLAKCDMKVYPLSAGSKVPVPGSHGEHDATNDLDIIKKWFDYNPNFNLAINLQASKLAVIDLDNHNNGINGIKNYRDYLLKHGNRYVDTLKTYSEYTPNNGLHIFYKLNQDLGNKDIQLMPGVELLTGKTVVAPSYIGQNDKRYTPAYNGFPELVYDKVKPLPQWIIDLATKSKQKPFHLTISYNTPGQKRWTGRLLDDLVHGATQGDRNNYLTQLTGKMFRVGADSDTVYNLLLFANSCCDTPLPDHEVNSIFGSILKKNGGR